MKYGLCYHYFKRNTKEVVDFELKKTPMVLQWSFLSPFHYLSLLDFEAWTLTAPILEPSLMGVE